MEFVLSLKSVCAALNVELSEIDDWNCCGGAAAHSMSNLLGLALPARNIAKAQVRDLPLVIPCPGCFNAVKRAQYALTSDDQMRKQLEEAVGFEYKGELEIRAMHELLLEQVGLDRIKSCVKRPLAGLKVVSYYGCALVRDPKVLNAEHGTPQSTIDHENPMFLDDIVTALGGEALDWSYKVDCCGADLGMSHAKIVKDISDKITGMAIEAGADCVTTGCGLCQINLDMRQTGKNGSKIPIMYFTELMGIAMDLPGRIKWWGKHIVSPKRMLKEKMLL